MIEKGADINLLDKEGNSPLHLANNLQITQELHSMSTVECTKILLEKGANTKIKNNNGDTPLHILHVPIEKTKLLIEHTDLFHEINNNQNTPLIQSIKFGSATIHHFALLLQKTDISCLKTPKDLLDMKGNTLLHNLICGLEFESFEKLLNEKKLAPLIDPLLNNLNSEGETILQLACKEDWEDGLALLLARGANWKKLNSRNQHTLEIIIESNAIRCLVYFIKQFKEQELSTWKQKILDHRDNDGDSFLHRAVSLGSLSCVEALLDFGFSPNTPHSNEHEYSDGGSPLHVASQNDNPEILKILIKKGGNVNSKDNFYGNTPLHIAARFDSFQCFQVLLENGADVSLLNNDEEEILQVAEYSNSSRCCDLLKQFLKEK